LVDYRAGLAGVLMDALVHLMHSKFERMKQRNIKRLKKFDE
jgi:hypothetical protein